MRHRCKLGFWRSLGRIAWAWTSAKALYFECVDNVKADAERRFKGTRVIEVALKLFEDRGHRNSHKWQEFWGQGDNDREYYFREAQGQLAADPLSWGTLYKWKRRFQKLLYPISCLTNNVNQRFDLPYKWQVRLYNWSHNISWQTGNWNIVPLPDNLTINFK